ncbi:STAS domain-containing protein [bacterium]|nr:STAS domain-containing protein [bacterium]
MFVNSQSFDISLARNEHSQIIRMSGEIDFAALIDLDPVLSKIIDDGEGELLMDMAEVTFIDSEGIRLLLNTFNKASQKNRKAQIIKCSPQVMRVLKLAGISEILCIHIEKAPPYMSREERVQPFNWPR